jgi:hypothetical protein
MVHGLSTIDNAVPTIPVAHDDYHDTMAMRSSMYSKTAVVLALLITTSSCATYYHSNLAFNEVFERGELQKALKTLQEKPSEGAGKKQFLYFVNNGLVLSLLGKYSDSNYFFERAYNFGEDYRINYANEAATYFTNPNFSVYRGEDHEHLLLLYFKAMNFLKMGKNEEALVECRRLNIRLQQLSDRYATEDKYRKDAFVHTLMGIIYESDYDYNNAFIAYRNAVEAYEGEFFKLFQISAPEQLKKDLLRTARLSGLEEEYQYFREKFGMPDEEFPERTGGELVFFWHNGLSPVKTEWSVSFAISQRNGMVYFSNAEQGLNYSFSSEGYSRTQLNSLSDLDVYRLTLPKYVERPVYYSAASLTRGDSTFTLQLLEDVNKVAFKCLDERMNLELSKALLRLAVKKATEESARSKDKWAGVVMNMVNLLTEAADTRNWQTLPHSIYYARIPLEVGDNTVTLETVDYTGTKQQQTFTYNVKQGQTHFHTYTSLETASPGRGF